MSRHHFECPLCGERNRKPDPIQVGSGAADHRCWSCGIVLHPGHAPTPDPAPPDLVSPGAVFRGFREDELAHATERLAVAEQILATAANYARAGNHQAAGQLYGLEFVRKLGTLACAQILDRHAFRNEATLPPAEQRPAYLRVVKAFDAAREAGADW